jgi:2-methylisocitrate lyase-like PEP mutase family enzyme
MLSPGASLKQLISRPEPTLVPLVLDPLMARLAAASGFSALYLGGGTLGYRKTVTEANLSLTQMIQEAVDIRAACPLPLILDAQCGWGDAMHVRNTVRMAEAAGVAALEIEDQSMPKRAHHHIGIEHLIPLEHMVEKIRTAVTARRDPDTLIIGRTNACRTHDLDEALRRAEAYRTAGADMLLILPRTPEQAVSIGERIEGPLFYMMLDGISSIGMPVAELGRYGYRIVLDALTPFYAPYRALRHSYAALAAQRPDPSVDGAFADETKHLHALIELEEMLAIERRTVER